MAEYPQRLFHSDAEIEHIGEGLLARTLPRAEWTHEAHLAATTYLLLKRPEIDLDRELPAILRRYNQSGGGVDRLRLKVWDKVSGLVVYDNQRGADDAADPTTALGGGSIVIHT